MFVDRSTRAVPTAGKRRKVSDNIGDVQAALSCQVRRVSGKSIYSQRRLEAQPNIQTLQVQIPSATCNKIVCYSGVDRKGEDF